MSTPDIPIPVNIQENEISTGLNSVMLFNFLMGIYTMVYGGTMYIYLSMKPANLNRRIGLSAISLLYLVCFLEFIAEWYYLNWTVVISGDTRESIFLGAVGEGPQWIWVIIAFLDNSSLIISDGLLIWRCYRVWGKSFRAIVVPLILFVVECGLFVLTMVLEIKFGHISSDATLSNIISSALAFVSLGTTVITTFFIGYRIYSTSRLNHSSSKILFKQIMTMIIESVAAYSLVLLLDAITLVVPSFTALGSPMLEAGHYIDQIIIIVAGMAPTILVARIATNDNHTVASSTAIHIYGLESDSQQGNGCGQSGNATGGDVNITIQADDAELTPVIEARREASTDATSKDNRV